MTERILWQTKPLTRHASASCFSIMNSRARQDARCHRFERTAKPIQPEQQLIPGAPIRVELEVVEREVTLPLTADALARFEPIERLLDV